MALAATALKMRWHFAAVGIRIAPERVERDRV